jgi:hypothetical protein
MHRVLLTSVATTVLSVTLLVPVSPVAAQQTPQPSRDTVTAPSTPMPGATATSPTGSSAVTPGAAPGAGIVGTAPTAPVERPNPLLTEDVSKVRGTDVRGKDDKKIGDIQTVLMKPDSKQVDRVVVAVGGVLGIGAHRVALPIDDLQWDTGTGVFRVSRTADELKSMPEWKAPSSTSAATGPDTGMTAPNPAVTPGSTAPSADQNAGTTK